jgi:hypothetical protein
MNRILPLRSVSGFAIGPALEIALVLACCLAAAPGLRAQTAPAAAQQSSSVPSQAQANPFPTDTTTVPIFPSKGAPALFPDESGANNGRITLPDNDLDPVRSPDDTAADTGTQGQGYSSSLSGLGNLLPGPEGNLPGQGKQNQNPAIAPMPQDTPKQDISVGNYYLDTKDWKGALSRFQSALVLAPDNPDVYWGLAECERHLGDYSDARANYLKVMEYDPGSHHAKDASKALRDPEIANAKPSSASQAAQTR